MKRLTSFLVALFLATTALWAYDFKVGDLYYIVTSSQSPSTVEVSKQNSSGYNYRGLTTADIPATVTYEGITYAVTAIADNAFESCKTLTAVSIPGSITTIGEKAFYGCTGLTEITVPENITYIGRDAFYSTGITSVVWNARNSTYNRYSSSESPFSSDVISITFGDKVDVIPVYLCSKMSKLTEIVIPDNVTSIEDGAFSGCTSLTSVTIPKGVTHMGPSIFSGCTKITTVHWNAVNCELSGHIYIGSLCHPFYDSRKAITSFTFGEGVETIPDYMCTDMVALTNLTLPSTLRHIGYSAFSGCKGLEEIELPAALEHIDDYAFNNCAGLLTLDIPDNVTTIGQKAFYGCSGITSLTIGKAVATIGTSAFEGCNGLFSVTWNARNCQNFSGSTSSPFGKLNTGIVLFAFGDEVENIPDYLCYGMSNVLSVDLPVSLKRIGNRAFYQCTGLETADLPDGLTQIGEYAFYGCAALTAVTIPESLRVVEKNAYQSCSNLEILDIKEGVEYIGDWAFSMCPKVVAVNIPKTVKHIGNAVFISCSGLRSVVWNVSTPMDFTSSLSPFNSTTSYSEPRFTAITFGSDVQHIPAYLCQSQRKLKSVIIPDNVLSIGNYAFSGCDSLAAIHIGANVREIGLYAIQTTPWYTAWWAAQDNGVAYINSVLMGYRGTMPANTTVKVKKWTTCIAGHAFYNEKNLTAISFPATITSIGDYAFSHCTGLTSCIIAGNIKRVGEHAFWDCKNIASLTIAEGVDSIGSSAFAGCEGLTSVVIPSTLKTLESLVFSDCKGLTSVTISEGVQTIKCRAFLRCTGLASITIPSTVENCESDICKDCTGLTSVVWNAKHCSDFGYSKYKGEKGPFASQYAQITSFTFGDGVEKIPSGICQYFTALPSITIPESVKCIGGDAFYGCNILRKVTVPANVDSVGQDAFYATGLQQVVWNARACKDIITTYPRIFSTEAPIVSFIFGKEVERIPAALCESRSKLISIVISNSVKEIGRRAFMDCTALNKLTLGTGLKTIGEYAFSGCAALKTVAIPDSVETMEYAAFGNCTKLATITIGKNLKTMNGGTFTGCSAITSITWNATHCEDFNLQTSNGSDRYSPFRSSVKQITSFTFADGVEMIPAQLCYGMEQLPSVTIPGSVNHIGKYAFYNNKALAAVAMEDGTGELDIQDYAFYYCPALKNLTLGHATTIGDYAFGSCSNIEALALPDNLTYIGQSAFEDCDKIAKVVIPDKVTTIRRKAFYEIDSLRFVSVGESVRIIEGGGSYNYAFGAYGSVKEVDWNAVHCRDVNSGIFSTGKIAKFSFGDKVERIPANLCAGMSGIDSINLPATLKGIGEYAFSSCSSVKKIILGENMQHIEYCAFNNCRGIDTIVTEAVVPPLCDTLVFNMNSFSGYTKTPVLVPCGSLDEYAAAFEWRKFGNLKEPVSEFVLTLQTENEEKGIVAFDEPMDCFNTAIISATPKSGYSFVQWSDGNSDNPRTLTITDDVTLIAMFSTPTDIESSPVADAGAAPRKVFRDGQVLILRGGKTCTLIGVEVR